MKILLSAYACEPNRGSEPGVGWHWALELVRAGHEVWVITRQNNQAVIEAALKADPLSPPEKLHFIYFDLPKWLTFWKQGGQGVHLYYFLWQMGIYFVARKLLKTVKLDVIHHVTFVSIRFPSFLGLLGVPFIFGPVSGGEKAPWALRQSFPIKGWIRDFIRDGLNAWVKWDPLMHLTFASAQKIYVPTPDTLAVLPKRYQPKTKIQLAIGIDPSKLNAPSCAMQNREEATPNTNANNPIVTATRPFRILYVGNLLYLKGIHLGLRAFAQLLEVHPNSQLTLIGSGSESTWLKQLARELNINASIEWIPKMAQTELMQRYPAYDVFLFPSLHDSGGMVILEAMAHGLPVVCLDLGGPGRIVDASCGRVIPTLNQNEAQVVCRLSEALAELASQKVLRAQLSKQTQARLQYFLWSNLIQQVYPSSEA